MSSASIENVVYYITIKKVYTDQIVSYELDFVNNEEVSEFQNKLRHVIQRDFGFELFHLVDVDYNSIHGIHDAPPEFAPPISYMSILRKITTNIIRNKKEFYFYVVPISESDIVNINNNNCIVCNEDIPLCDIYGCSGMLCQGCFIQKSISENIIHYIDCCSYCNPILSV